MKKLLRFVVLATLVSSMGCMALIERDTMHTVPQRKTGSFDRFLPEVRRAIRAKMPKDKILDVYMADQQWFIRRHNATARILTREVAVIVARQSPDGRCWYNMFAMFQRHEGGGRYGGVDVGHPQGSDGYDKPMHKKVDCKEFGLGEPTAKRKAKRPPKRPPPQVRDRRPPPREPVERAPATPPQVAPFGTYKGMMVLTIHMAGEKKKNRETGELSFIDLGDGEVEFRIGECHVEARLMRKKFKIARNQTCELKGGARATSVKGNFKIRGNKLDVSMSMVVETPQGGARIKAKGILKRKRNR